MVFTDGENWRMLEDLAWHESHVGLLNEFPVPPHSQAARGLGGLGEARAERNSPTARLSPKGKRELLSHECPVILKFYQSYVKLLLQESEEKGALNSLHIRGNVGRRDDIFLSNNMHSDVQNSFLNFT